MRMFGAAMMLMAAVVFGGMSSFWLLLVAATVGVISPSGNEVGPFLPIEQAALAQLVPPGRRTGVLAWYNLAGSLATALGALAGGATAQILQGTGWGEADSYRQLVIAYGCCGLLLGFVFAGLSVGVEVGPEHRGVMLQSR